MTISEKIYKIRTDLGLSQKEFADKVGVSQSAINFWENGKRQPRIEQLRKIAAALGVNISDLVDDWTVFSRDEIEKDWTNAFNGPDIKTATEEYPRSEENGLIDDFRKLNTDGQQEARKRVQELTEIKRYMKQQAPSAE